MLIDRSFLLPQLNRYDSAGHLEAWSELLFGEADPALVNAFYGMWCEIESDPQTRALTESDLLAPSTADRTDIWRRPTPCDTAGTS